MSDASRLELLWSSRSPFARKVMVAAHELGLADRIACRRVVVANEVVDGTVLASNPLNQIPTLLLPDGTALFDSGVIVDYLDGIGGGTLIPGGGPGRLSVLRAQVVGDGLAQHNRARLAEARRGQQASPEYRAAYARKTGATLDWLERSAAELARVDAGAIAVAVALSHLDFRFPDEGWRTGRPALAAWHATFARRPSMRATEFDDRV